MKTVSTCPLGHTCEKVVGDHVERCQWFLQLDGNDPQSGEKLAGQSKCVMVWDVILKIEGNREVFNLGAGVQSLRNETVKRQTIALEAINDLQISSSS